MINVQADFENFVQGSFSETASVNGTDIKVIFNDYSSDTNLGDIQSEVNAGRKNFITSKNLSGEIVEGDTVIIRSISYTVYKVEDFNSYELLVWIGLDA